MNTFGSARMLLLALALAAPLVARAAPSPGVQQEVNYLIGYIGSSGCEFFRNGSWSDAKTAQAHVQAKYDWVRAKVGTAAEFIDMAASKSSLSGQPYQVRCGQAPPVTSNAWLNEALARHQAQAQH